MVFSPQKIPATDFKTPHSPSGGLSLTFSQAVALFHFA
jgi:hypothetical protein